MPPAIVRSVRIFLVAAVLAASAGGLRAEPWRSSLYPDNWSAGYADKAGRFLHDFSHAGYHRGEAPIPDRVNNVIDVTHAPYAADAFGKLDATAAIQRALDAVADAGGGVVFMPAGTYRVAPPEGAKSALVVHGDGVVLRGAGAGRTFLFNDATAMADKRVIELKPRGAVSWNADGKAAVGVKLREDLSKPTSRIPLDDVAEFSVGDLIVVRNDLTQHFIDLVGMNGKWTPGQSQNRTLTYCRRITAIDAIDNVITVDIPLRGFLYTADNAQVVKVSGRMISEAGLEDFSIGMKQHPGAGTEEEDWSKPGTVGHDVHGSAAIALSFAENCWVRRVHTYAPEGNDPKIHMLSNVLKLWRTRLVSVADCDFKFPQYRGGGGNGYGFAVNGQDNLIRDCRVEGARHNYDFGTMSASGNVIVDCLAKNGKLGSDFHMFLSLANLLDNITCEGDFLEARALRPWGGNPMHGVTTTQSVFWNTKGLRYSLERPVLVYSHQFGDGYVIGTGGPAAKVDSSDFVEGEGRGEDLVPRSLYFDQLKRRLAARP
ncbi:MAG: glycosyl hydrolase family 28-related protein [Rariglobus sp.]|nr:glycosyl hydrolase family 28-related protein [Rariglobus sp.]